VRDGKLKTLDVQLRKAGVNESVVEKLATLSGRKFDDRAALFAAWATTLGKLDEWTLQVASHGVSYNDVFHRQTGPVVAFYADGYLGQYIVIVPATRIVAVRQVEYADDQKDSDTYDDFVKRVIALSDSIGKRK
jgi:CubicO group peptidase (beta-lactamase class C family)